jgi:sulfatase modifying factor 1
VKRALLFSLLCVGCPAEPAGYPLRTDCPGEKPAEGAKCTGDAERYCAFPVKEGAEDVCYCEDGGWACYHKPGHPAPKTSASVAPAPTPSVAVEPEGPACPDDMAFVDTTFCPKVKLDCAKSSRNPDNNLTICHKFNPGQRCLEKERRQRFCIDRYEYPNKAGAHPPVMVSAYDAAQLCAEQGKRMCFESEWTAACEGPEKLPFPYGLERSKEFCNIDNPWIKPDLEKVHHPKDKIRGPELTRLDQSVRSGAKEKCKSGFGVHDLTGNFDEWVRTESIRGRGKWAGLKGGGWGYVRNACRPITTSHVPQWSYYFIAFRCCKDPGKKATPSDVPLWEPPATPAPAHPAGKPLDRGYAPTEAGAN